MGWKKKYIPTRLAILFIALELSIALFGAALMPVPEDGTVLEAMLVRTPIGALYPSGPLEPDLTISFIDKTFGYTGGVTLADPSGEEPSVAVDSGGTAVVAYVDKSDPVHHVLKVYVKCAGGSSPKCSSGIHPITDQLGAFKPGKKHSPEVIFGPDGFPMIFYFMISPFNPLNERLILAKCNDISCSSSPRSYNYLVGYGPKYNPARISAAVHPSGQVVFAWHHVSNGLMVTLCTNPLAVVPCENTFQSSVDNALTTFLRPSLGIGGDGLPVIAYHEYPNKLKFVHCGNISCNPTQYGSIEPFAQNTFTELDSANAGSYSSLAIGENKLPVIAYRGAGALKLLRCSDQKCVSNVPVATVIPQTTSFVSLKMDLKGNPQILHLDQSAALSLISCANVGCTGANAAFQIEKLPLGQVFQQIALGVIPVEGGVDRAAIPYIVPSSAAGTLNYFLKYATCPIDACDTASLPIEAILVARVENIGSAPAGANTSEFKLNGPGGGIQQYSVPSLNEGAGQNFVATFAGAAKKTFYTAQAIADVLNVVAESDETNNSASISFTTP